MRLRPPTASWLGALVEERVARAQANGEFDDLPGTGKPLQLDDDRLVPEGLRMTDRVLQNAGFLPPEMQTLKDIRALEQRVRASVDDASRRRALARLSLLLSRAAEARGAAGGAVLHPDEACFQRVVERLLDTR